MENLFYVIIMILKSPIYEIELNIHVSMGSFTYFEYKVVIYFPQNQINSTWIRLQVDVMFILYFCSNTNDWPWAWIAVSKIRPGTTRSHIWRQNNLRIHISYPLTIVRAVQASSQFERPTITPLQSSSSYLTPPPRQLPHNPTAQALPDVFSTTPSNSVPE